MTDRETASRVGNASQRILDAAETVAGRDGLGKMSLELVAKEAGVTKAGVLYHFNSKQTLIEAMIARLCEAMEARWRDRLARERPDDPCRVARAAIALTFDDQSEFAAFAQRVCAVVLAAAAHDPALLEPFRCKDDQLNRELLAALPPDVAEVVLSALDGVWMARMFQMYSLDSHQAVRLRHGLELLAGLHDPARCPSC